MDQVPRGSGTCDDLVPETATRGTSAVTDVGTMTTLSVERLTDQKPLMLTRQFAFWLNDRWRAMFPRLRPAPAGSVDWRPCVFLAFLPIGLDLCLRIVGEGSSWRALAWMVIAATLLTVLLSSAPWGWNSVRELAPRIDDMLDVHPDSSEPATGQARAERDGYLTSVAERLPLRRSHYVQCAVWSVAALVGTYFASKQLPHVTFGPAYYLNIAVLGCLGFDSLRWMVRIPIIVVKPLIKVRRLRVVMHSPTTTPAIREMAQLFEETAFRAGAALFVLGLWLLWEVFSARSHHGLDASYVGELGLLGLGPLLVSAALVIYVTFIPQFWLAEIVRVQRDRLLDELSDDLPQADPAKLLSDDAQSLMKLYDTIADSSTDTATVRVIARRVLAVIAVLAPQIVAAGVKLLHLG
jgi:hypothetical protein